MAMVGASIVLTLGSALLDRRRLPGGGESGVIGNDALLIKGQQGMVHGDHPELPARLDLRVQLVDRVLAYVMPHTRSADQYFAGKNAPFALSVEMELLGDDRLDGIGQ